MRVTVLGSGTSHGVPMIGCRCAVCTSDDPRNKRFRPSITVSNEQGTILVDTTPELRMQCLAFGLDRVDAVLFTHTHADHVFGLDDLRLFNEMSGSDIPVYGDAKTLEDIRRIYRYIFMETQQGGGKPKVTLHEAPDSFELLGTRIQALPVIHGRLPILAYRFDDFAYVTDVSHIPDETMARLHGLEMLILDAVRFEPHPTHFGLWQAMEIVEQLKPKQTLFTHLSHHFDHETTNAMLPPYAQLAYDGQVIELSGGF
jgi:phosphoribosyl 1,2-cyclic phosphate phosphodiesterase